GRHHDGLQAIARLLGGHELGVVSSACVRRSERQENQSDSEREAAGKLSERSHRLPLEGRGESRKRAGLLTRGSSSSGAFPEFPSGLKPLSSPLTVAGPCRNRTDFPGLQREAHPTLAADLVPRRA